MNKLDAYKILGLTSEITPEIIKDAYRRACSKYHPDRNPSGLHMMQLVNVAYDTIKNETATVEGSQENYGESLCEALNKIINLKLIIEVCGAWVWVSGNTKEHKEILKEAGFKWASKKKSWYFRPADYKSRSRGNFSMSEIRVMHGSTFVENKENKQLKLTVNY